MKYALIGCGRIAVNHMKAAINNKLEIVAVCDVLPEKMEALLAKYDLQNDTSIKRYTDYKQMLAENDITLASIATESGIHAEVARYCHHQGEHGRRRGDRPPQRGEGREGGRLPPEPLQCGHSADA